MTINRDLSSIPVSADQSSNPSSSTMNVIDIYNSGLNPNTLKLSKELVPSNLLAPETLFFGIDRVPQEELVPSNLLAPETLLVPSEDFIVTASNPIPFTFRNEIVSLVKNKCRGMTITETRTHINESGVLKGLFNIQGQPYVIPRRTLLNILETRQLVSKEKGVLARVSKV